MPIHERVWERAAAPSQPWRPVGTYALLGVLAGVWVLQEILLAAVKATAASAQEGGLPFGFLVYNGRLFDLPSFLFLIDGDVLWRPWTLVTSTVAHSFRDPMHLLFNGLFLFFFGPTVERLVGTRRFLALFFAGGAVAGVAQVALDGLLHGPPSPILAVSLGYGGGALGASGALMLLFGILIILMPNQKLLVYGIVPVPFWIAGIGYAALDVLGAFNPASRVGNFAHLAGMALGLGYGLWQKQDWRRRGVRLVTG